MWTVLIQCRLVGKAIRVYNALDEGVARDYNKVKAIVLKAYDLVPEAYRLKFRNFTKPVSLSFVEFARLKEEQFDDWLKSRQVVSFSSLRELMLLEEFKKACSKELRIYLEEVKAVSLSKAAQIADEFVLTHRAGSGNLGSVVNFQPGKSNNYQKKLGGPGNNLVQGNLHKNRTGDAQGEGSSGSYTRVFSKSNKLTSGNGNRVRRACFWCNEPGHFQAQCNARRRYLQRNNNNPVALISNNPMSNKSQVENPPVLMANDGCSKGENVGSLSSRDL
ncbi:uncharacterized protein LOC135223148 [Macrobrachium nipponense]|uniref:uncharacterized protein LOC135223148 n=1 Tax=Macrobrachium nipponense TaxID=159736 RepID=UPI0030C8AD8F